MSKHKYLAVLREHGSDARAETSWWICEEVDGLRWIVVDYDGEVLSEGRRITPVTAVQEAHAVILPDVVAGVILMRARHRQHKYQETLHDHGVYGAMMIWKQIVNDTLDRFGVTRPCTTSPQKS